MTSAATRQSTAVATAVVGGRHPGLPTLPRRLGLRATGVRHAVEAVPPGEELFAFCHALARRLDARAAMLCFGYLPLARAALQLCEDDPERRTILRYGAPVHFDPGCELLGGQMSVGHDGRDPVLHGHGYLRDRDGQLWGGHLSPGHCVVGAAAVGGPPGVVRCTVLDGLVMRPGWDDETGFRLLSPALNAEACR